MAIERLDVVTSSPARHDAFARLLPNAEVRRFDPHFTEELIPKPVNTNPSEWPMEMAEKKALHDLAAMYVIATTNEEVFRNMVKEVGGPDEGKHIRIYSDTITVFRNPQDDSDARVLEKPRDIPSWLKDKEKGALSLSGKNIEICTAITAMDVKNPDTVPTTVLIRIVSKMRPYNIGDVEQIIAEHGPQAVLTTAGGISLWNGGTHLYDGDTPLRVYLQADAQQDPVLINEIPGWQSLPVDDLKQILYGALPEALESVVSRLDSLHSEKKIIKSIPVTVRQKRSSANQDLRGML
jgi:hypothetical protein